MAAADAAVKGLDRYRTLVFLMVTKSADHYVISNNWCSSLTISYGSSKHVLFLTF
jgi:hypothetical protein